MNWKSINFDWNRARAFLVTAQEGTLTAAAKALGMTQSTLGRQVTALEDELGVVLFERVGRNLVLTPGGVALLDHVQQMGQAAAKLSIAATGQSETLEGNISITASEATAIYTLPVLIAKLRKKYPGITVEIIASNSSSDLRKREADIAIRNFSPTHEELISKQLGESRAYLYATAAYIKKLGHPKSGEDLSDADFVGFTDNKPYIDGLQQAGVSVSAANFPLSTESHLLHWELVKQGIAIGIMPDYIGDSERKVKRVLPDMEPMTFNTWLVVHRELHTNNRVRTVYDFLANELPPIIT